MSEGFQNFKETKPSPLEAANVNGGSVIVPRDNAEQTDRFFLLKSFCSPTRGTPPLQLHGIFF